MKLKVAIHDFTEVPEGFARLYWKYGDNTWLLREIVTVDQDEDFVPPSGYYTYAGRSTTTKVYTRNIKRKGKPMKHYDTNSFFYADKDRTIRLYENIERAQKDTAIPKGYDYLYEISENEEYYQLKDQVKWSADTAKDDQKRPPMPLYRNMGTHWIMHPWGVPCYTDSVLATMKRA